MMATQGIRRRSSIVDPALAEQLLLGPAATTTTAMTKITSIEPRPARQTQVATSAEAHHEMKRASVCFDSEAMPPPPPPPRTPALPEDEIQTRPSRSASSSSRSTNRLSLTLPIAPPTSDPTRPTPTSSVMSSFPPTPVDTSAFVSPADTNDFIIAVAAQERKVLELREELSRAEAELVLLKKQWSSHEQHKKRNEMRNMEPLRSIVPSPEGTSPDDNPVTRRSAELDRRKALLQSAQGSPVSTPNSARRKIFRGAHTRTLSLASPAKAEAGFSFHEDAAGLKSPDVEQRHAQALNASLSKRASWQPRTYNTNATGVKQIAEDFKLGLWSFVEDIRQATVGDEPINGQQPRVPAASGTPRRGGEGEDTIRAPAPMRSRLSSVFDQAGTPGSQRSASVLQEHGNAKVKGSKAKHFSWTPLTFENFDDNDWSNWDSPASVKSPRWSGSTVGGGENIPSIPEKGDEFDTPLKRKSTSSSRPLDLSGTPSPPLLSPAKLEDFLPHVVKGFSPSNIKRTASDLMTQWEKSLATPEPAAVEMKENVI